MSDEEGFANSVYEYLYEELEKHKQLEEGKNILVAPELVMLATDNEIQIAASALVPNKMVKWILESYLKSDPSKFKDHGVIEFGGAFTVGKILHPSQMEMLTCEICGFFTPYGEELYTHRTTHFGV